MKKKEPQLVFKGFRDAETGKFEPLPSASELKRLLKIMGEIICGTQTHHAG
jgi:hypothetical protein